MTEQRTVRVPPVRVERWFENFATRHGPCVLTLDRGRLVASAYDGETAVASLSLDRRYDGPVDPAALRRAAEEPIHWGILLVRRGGFAVAALEGCNVLASKVGQRHVQGRTKAGGQSSQRFARRRGNQARAAYEAAADHAYRVLKQGPGEVTVLVCGGDHAAVDAVLTDRRLEKLLKRRSGLFLPVPDPRRSVLDAAIGDALCVQVVLTPNGLAPGDPTLPA